MSNKPNNFIIAVAPHIKKEISIQRIMYTVIITLLPAIVLSVFFFGTKTLFLYFVAVVTAMLTEACIKLIRKQSYLSILDGSAIITGLLLVMTLPPDISWQITALGAAIAILIGKEVFGGLGSNIWNPALVGRAFLSAAYPIQMTTFHAPQKVFSFLPDAVSSATPLAASKFDKLHETFINLFFGQTGGSIGETSALALIVGGIILLSLKLINWRLVVSYIGTVFVLGGIFYLIDPSVYPSPIFHVFSGGLILGAFYMATDMVTSPYTNSGNIIFGVGAGLLVIVIRLFAGYPEGVMFSILIMNSFTPLINKYTKTKTFGDIPAPQKN